MDDRSLFRFKPGYHGIDYKPALDWSAWNVQNDPRTEALTAPGSGGDPTGGFAKASRDVQQQRAIAGSSTPARCARRSASPATRSI
jgi:hypothetical protein